MPFSFLMLTGLFHGCTEDPVLPALTTIAATDITRNTVTSGGEITDDGGSPVLGRGVCWSTSQNPDFTKKFTMDGAGSGTFSVNITGLIPNTIYYIRAYATNKLGTAFGKQISFITDPVGISTLTTNKPSSITLTTAVLGGKITSDGDGTITERGVCWDTSPDPEITDSFKPSGEVADSFNCNITGLSPGTQYFVRAYAENSAGIAYGEEISFNTQIADIQGNLYNTITIGSQIWMSENLRTIRYNNNTSIPNITGTTSWVNLKGPGYCWYNNEITYKPTLGALYSWYTVNTGKLCPAGWHVPTDAEFNTLEINLGMDPSQVNVWGWRGTDQGTKMKSTTGWDNGGNGTNASGFTVLAGGYRSAGTGYFVALGSLTYFWSSTEHDIDRGWYRRLDGTNSDIYKASTSKNGGKYVRCIKN